MKLLSALVGTYRSSPLTHANHYRSHLDHKHLYCAQTALLCWHTVQVSIKCYSFEVSMSLTYDVPCYSKYCTFVVTAIQRILFVHLVKVKMKKAQYDLIYKLFRKNDLLHHRK